MSRNPDDLVRLSESEARRLARLYMEAEREILIQVDRAMARGNDLRYLRSMLDNTQAILEDLLTGNRQWCEQAIPRVYIEGANFASEMAGKAAAGFGAIHQQAVKVLADNTFDRLDSVRQVIGRRSEDLYRQYALETTRQSVIGYKSWQQVSREFRDRLRVEGITGFRDARGREWNMKTYAEMVARTTTMEAHLAGTANRLLELGHDLVKVSTHMGSCPKCIPWQGKVLSLTGKTPGYPTLEEARQAGLMHPNCRHAYGLYLNMDADIEALEEGSGQRGNSGTSARAAGALTQQSHNATIEVRDFEPLGGGVSSTFTGTVHGKKYVFKADEIPPGMNMLRSNLEAELLAEKVLNHLGLKAPKTEYREFDVGGGDKRTLLSVEFVDNVLTERQFLRDYDFDRVKKTRFRTLQVIDVLIGNGDRHGGNFFMAKSGDVIPIDHNLAFATDMVIEPGVTWQKCFLDTMSRLKSHQTPEHIMVRNDIGEWLVSKSSLSQYTKIARDVQRRLSDAYIERTVEELPDFLAERARKQELIRVLKYRRDNLVTMIRKVWGP